MESFWAFIGLMGVIAVLVSALVGMYYWNKGDVQQATIFFVFAVLMERLNERAKS